MKAKIIARIVIYSVVLLVLVSLLAAAIGLRSYSFVKHADTEYAVEGTALFSPEKYHSLKIDWAAGDIVLQSADVDSIQISETAGSEPMYITESGETISIQFLKHNSGVGLKNHKSKDLTILVPQVWECDKLEIDAASTEVHVCDLTVYDADVDTASGKIIFENCSVEKLDMDSASGNLEFTGCLKELDIDSVSANARLNLDNVPDRIEMDSVSGELDLTLPSDSGFTLKSSSLSSKLDCNFAVDNRDGYTICGDGHCWIELSGLSGKIGIHKGSSPASDWCAHGTGEFHEAHVKHH